MLATRGSGTCLVPPGLVARHWLIVDTKSVAAGLVGTSERVTEKREFERAAGNA